MAYFQTNMIPEEFMDHRLPPDATCQVAFNINVPTCTKQTGNYKWFHLRQKCPKVDTTSIYWSSLLPVKINLIIISKLQIKI